ncbi:6373_t:CDS:2, partial [Acaulospora morrowiae]
MDKQINVAIFGITGGGKSTIANMLLVGDLSDNNPFQIGDCARGVTSDLNHYFNGKFGVIDLPGFGEGPSGTVKHSEAIKIAREHFSAMELPLNYIFYVKKKGRFTEAEHVMFNEFKDIFNDAEDKIVIIITNCKEKEWIVENSKEIKKNFDNLLEKLSFLNYEGIIPEVYSSFEIAEQKAEKWVSLTTYLIGGGVAYNMVTSGVYFMKGKPKIAKERLKKALTDDLLHTAGLPPLRE